MKLTLPSPPLLPERLSVPSTSGLRDETSTDERTQWIGLCFQYPQPRVYAMKHIFSCEEVQDGSRFQYPQPRVYAMKLARQTDAL